MTDKLSVRDAGRLGGRTRTANMTPEELKASAAKAGRSRWDQMTPEEREAHMAKMQAARRRWQELRVAAMSPDCGIRTEATVADSPGCEAGRDDDREGGPDAPPRP